MCVVEVFCPPRKIPDAFKHSRTNATQADMLKNFVASGEQGPEAELRVGTESVDIDIEL